MKEYVQKRQTINDSSVHLRPKKNILVSQASPHCPQSPRITDFFKPKKKKKKRKNPHYFFFYFVSSMFIQYLIFLIHLPDLLKIE